MSNYLTQLKINNLQAELDAAILAQGFVTPMVVDIDGNGKAIQNLGIISAAQGTLENVNAGSITATGAVSAASLVLSTPLTVPGLVTQSIIAPALAELNIENTTAGDRIFIGYTTSGTKVYTGELHPDVVLTDSISCTLIEQTTNGGDPAGTFQAGIREGVVTADGIIANTIGAHDNPSITFTAPIVLAAGQVFTGLDVNFLSIGNALYMGSATSMSCATTGDRFTITDVVIENVDYIALANQQAGGSTLSISSNVVETKPMLTVVDNAGINRGSIYDSYYNPPPSVAASTLTAILANGSSAGDQKITDVLELDASVIQGGIIQVLPSGGTDIGNVFDTVYNPPSISGPISYNSSGIKNYSFTPTLLNLPVMNFSFPPTASPLSFVSDINLYLNNLQARIGTVTGSALQFVLWIGASGLAPTMSFQNLPVPPIAYSLISATTGLSVDYSSFLFSTILPSAFSYGVTFSLYIGPVQDVTSTIQILELLLQGQMIANFVGATVVTTSEPV